MAKIVYKGKFDGDMNSLPHSPHIEGAVKFKEADNPKQLAAIANALSVVLFVLLLIISIIIVGKRVEGGFSFNFGGFVLSLMTLLPHEYLHAICFKETVYVYTYLSKGMMFVVGTEAMSKRRYIAMSLLPNIVFGFIPYILFLIYPQFSVLGSLGIFCILMGVGDYYNVFNALTQMPKGAKTYLHKFNSYWYLES